MCLPYYFQGLKYLYGVNNNHLQNSFILTTHFHVKLQQFYEIWSLLKSKIWFVFMFHGDISPPLLNEIFRLASSSLLFLFTKILMIDFQAFFNCRSLFGIYISLPSIFTALNKFVLYGSKRENLNNLMHNSFIL